MSHVQVTPEQIVDHAHRLSGIAPHIGELHGGLGAHVDAAAGTSGHAAVQDSFSRWATALPHFARAADGLLVAMALAGAGYRVADDAVGDACAAPPGSED